jgi:hypothetical protein
MLKKSHNIYGCKKCDKTFTYRMDLKTHIKEEHSKTFKCKSCDETFEARWILEVHMKDHEARKEFKCEICNKEFFLKWRLNQHKRGHDENERRFCHYFNNNKTCPYEEIGCKFRHEISENCYFGKSCKNYLCQFKHESVQEVLDNSHLIEGIGDKGDKTEEVLDKSEKHLHTSSFLTSTPKKTINQCEECMDTSECTECIVKHMLGQHGAKTTFF